MSTTTITLETSGLVRLMTWLSPAFPTGAFAYSHGLEAAFQTGLVTDRDSLQDWLDMLVRYGSGWNDAVLCAEGWKRAAEAGDLAELAGIAEAMAGGRERHLETMAQGRAFLAAAMEWPEAVPSTLAADCALPVAVGVVSARMGISAEATLGAYLNAYLSNHVQAALRLGFMGQQQGVSVQVALEDTVVSTAQRAVRSSLDDLGSATFNAEIMALSHETLETRIFRS